MAAKCKKTKVGAMASFGSLARMCEPIAPTKMMAERPIENGWVGGNSKQNAAASSPNPINFINQIG